eukprot:5928623-Amphidinium_carterae.1
MSYVLDDRVCIVALVMLAMLCWDGVALAQPAAFMVKFQSVACLLHCLVLVDVFCLLFPLHSEQFGVSAQVAAVVKVCSAANVIMVPRGAGTGPLRKDQSRSRCVPSTQQGLLC